MHTDNVVGGAYILIMWCGGGGRGMHTDNVVWGGGAYILIMWCGGGGAYILIMWCGGEGHAY